MISINFKLSRWDIFYANLIANFQQPYLVILFVLLAVWTSYLNWTSTSSEYNLIVRVLTVIVLCIPPFLWVFGVVALFLFFVTMSKNNETILAQQSWAVDDEMLVYESQYARSEIKWLALRRVIPVGNYLFLYLSQMGACIIPKRAFASDQVWKEFIGLCRSKLKKK